jgi:hypothetical protein
MKEQRQFTRIRFGFRAEEKSGHGRWMIEDISEGGCFLRALERLPIGSMINLIFQLPGSFRYIEAVGEVKHVNKRGTGVEFLEIDMESKREAEGFVRDFMHYQEGNYGKT